MQEVTITKSALFSAAFTRDMLLEVAVKLCGYSMEAAVKLADSKLAKPSKLMAGLEAAKLRTVLDQKLSQSPDEEYGELYRTEALTWEFECLPDLDIGNAGRNTKRNTGGATGAKRASKLSGAYEVVKKAGNAEADEGKWAIWQYVWNCVSFEEYFAHAPAKSVTKTGRVISASSEIQWAVKSGWIKPISA